MVTEFENRDDHGQALSKTLRAERRTYFFDVKSTKSEQTYLTITESKRRFDNQTGNFFYEKHKIFLYEEDMEDFSNTLSEIVQIIKTQKSEIKTTPADEITLNTGNLLEES